MKNIRKARFILFVSIALVVILFTTILSSCGPGVGIPRNAWYGKNESYFETEFFECIRLGSDDFGWQDKVQICGLTELGKEQEELIIPSYINGFKVKKINYKAPGVSGFYGANFNKIFIPNGVVGATSNTFGNAPVDKILYLGSQHPGDINLEGLPSTWLYVPSLYYDANTLKHFRVKPANVSFMYNYEESSNGEYYWMGEARKYENEVYKNIPIGYEFGGWFMDEEGKEEFIKKSFWETRKFYPKWKIPNGGYYWIDDLDEGQPLKTIPAEPEREGYTFEGWYYEEGCINMVDLSTFIKTEYEEETIFYAKWKKV